MSTEWPWDEMLTTFRSLGGIIDNVRLGRGPHGRGLFPSDPTKPIRIQVPDNLLISSDDVELRSDKIRLRKAANVPTPERAFFERYQDVYSWGGGGRDDVEALIDLYAGIPESISGVLSKYFGKDAFPSKKTKDGTLKRFLTSRRLRTADDRKVLMPILELVNHDMDGSPFKFENGISLSGQYLGEIYARYNLTDPFGSFFTWGFAGSPTYAFSLPMALSFGKRRILIRRNLNEKRRVSDMLLPVVTSDDSTVTLSFLMIGSARNPRRVRTTFGRTLAPFNLPRVDEIFDRIRSANSRRFIDLLSSLEQFNGESVSALRKMALLQLEAITNCHGGSSLTEIAES